MSDRSEDQAPIEAGETEALESFDATEEADSEAGSSVARGAAADPAFEEGDGTTEASDGDVVDRDTDVQDDGTADVDADTGDVELDVDADADETLLAVARGKSGRDIATDVTATDREAAANEAAERNRAGQGKKIGLLATRGAAGVAVLALGLYGVMASVPESIAQTPTRTTSVLPASPAEARVCAGPLLRVGLDDGTADVVSQIAGAAVSTDGDSLETQDLAFVDVEGASATSVTGTSLSGAQTATVNTDTAIGLSASECAEPATEQWLVGGATSTGRTTLLTVANPNQHNVSVDVRIFGPQGAIDAAGSTGIAVNANSAVVIDLAGLAPDLVSPVVNVTALGGPVSAHLQQSVLRGLVPGGIDQIDPGVYGTDLVLPAVRIEQQTGVAAAPGLEDAAPALRLFTEEDTVVGITTVPQSGEPVETVMHIVGGAVTEFDLLSLGEGVYSVFVESDLPVVAGIRQTTVNATGQNDFDWISATNALPESVAFVVADGPSPRLSIVNTTEEQQTYQVDDYQVVLDPHTQIVNRVEVGQHAISGTGAAVSITYATNGQLASYTVTPRGPADDGMTVVIEP